MLKRRSELSSRALEDEAAVRLFANCRGHWRVASGSTPPKATALTTTGKASSYMDRPIGRKCQYTTRRAELAPSDVAKAMSVTAEGVQAFERDDSSIGFGIVREFARALKLCADGAPDRLPPLGGDSRPQQPIRRAGERIRSCSRRQIAWTSKASCGGWAVSLGMIWALPALMHHRRDL